MTLPAGCGAALTGTIVTWDCQPLKRNNCPTSVAASLFSLNTPNNANPRVETPASVGNGPAACLGGATASPRAPTDVSRGVCLPYSWAIILSAPSAFRFLAGIIKPPPSISRARSVPLENTFSPVMKFLVKRLTEREKLKSLKASFN